MTKDRNRGITHSKWFLPSFSFVLGLVILAVTWLGGHPGVGVGSLVGLIAFGRIRDGARAPAATLQPVRSDGEALAP